MQIICPVPLLVFRGGIHTSQQGTSSRGESLDPKPYRYSVGLDRSLAKEIVALTCLDDCNLIVVMAVAIGFRLGFFWFDRSRRMALSF